jgi:hypothetical protein
MSLKNRVNACPINAILMIRLFITMTNWKIFELSLLSVVYALSPGL